MISLSKYFLIVTFAVLSFSLNGNVEYKIITLLPSDFDRNANPNTTSTIEMINDSGYVIGQLEMDPDKKVGQLYIGQGFVYHPGFGFKVISGSDENSNIYMTDVDDQGLCKGIQQKSLIDKNGIQKIITCAFTYDSHTEQFSETEIHLPNDDTILMAIPLENDQFFIITIRSYDLQTVILDNKTGQYIHTLPTISLSGTFKDYCTFGSGIYSPKDGLKELGSLDPHHRWPVKTFVINDNCVAGTGKDINGVKQGFIWSREKGFSLFPIPFKTKIYLNALNQHEQLVGSMSVDETATSRAFLYSPSNGMIMIGSLGGETSDASDINNHSVVVGSSTIKKNSIHERAFIWDKTRGMRDLNQLIPRNTKWLRLTEGEKINNNGWIVGSGIYEGCETGFLLIPKAL